MHKLVLLPHKLVFLFLVSLVMTIPILAPLLLKGKIVAKLLLVFLISMETVPVSISLEMFPTPALTASRGAIASVVFPVVPQEKFPFCIPFPVEVGHLSDGNTTLFIPKTEPLSRNFSSFTSSKH